MVERHVGRRADDDEDAAPVDAESLDRARVGLEVGQVVLLLETGVAAKLGRLDPVAAQPLRRDDLWDDDARGRTAAELMLHVVALGTPSERAAMVSSCEPCASAMSKPRPRAQERSAGSRETSAPSLRVRERPPCRPSSVASRPCSRRSSTVCAYSRAVISTS